MNEVLTKTFTQAGIMDFEKSNDSLKERAAKQNQADDARHMHPNQMLAWVKHQLVLL
ncbi:MAG: hypothetical protein ABIN24_15130 [Dyadobacter sp.]